MADLRPLLSRLFVKRFGRRMSKRFDKSRFSIFFGALIAALALSGSPSSGIISFLPGGLAPAGLPRVPRVKICKCGLSTRFAATS